MAVGLIIIVGLAIKLRIEFLQIAYDGRSINNITAVPGDIRNNTELISSAPQSIDTGKSTLEVMTYSTAAMYHKLPQGRLLHKGYIQDGGYSNNLNASARQI